MLPQVRIVLITTLATSLWFLADGVKFLMSGRFLGQRLSPADASSAPYALQLTDGTFVDYGIWAAWLVAKGYDPHDLAPVFFVLGFVGLIGLFFFLRAQPIGWALLVGFSVLSFPRLGAVGIAAAVLLVTLILPATRRLIFEGEAQNLEGIELRPASNNESNS
jgi:hypothetical protein